MKRLTIVAVLCCTAAFVFGQSGLVTDFTGGNVPLVTRGNFVLRGTQLVSYTGNERNLVIPEDLGISEIGPSCFTDSYLTSVVIPQGVRRIGRNAFSSSRNLASVTLPEGLLVIDDNAFSYCSNLIRINIPAGIAAIGNNAFNDCSRLIVVTMPENIIYLSGSALPNNFITAYENSGRRSGSYTFTRGFNAWRYGTEPIHQAQLITPGTPVSGSFQLTTENWYYLEVPAGGAIVMAHTEGSLDTVMTIYEGSGTTLDEDDDSGSGNNARINVVANEGMLYIKVRMYGGSSGSRESYQLHTAVEAL
ncbi:MAG: leucine-rich repeat protein [Treponema sp.]|jgi:hypothetical protein|nr:leucine-rich repeat protein [Treponema sp.]